MKRNKVYPLVIGFQSLLVMGLIFISFDKSSTFKSLETQSLKITSPKGEGSIYLSIEDNKPIFSMTDSKGNQRVVLQGGQDPKILMKNENNQIIAKIDSINKGARISLFDEKEKENLKIESGKTPGVYLYDDLNKQVATFNLTEEKDPEIYLSKSTATGVLKLQGGEKPGISLKNQYQKTVGTWTLLSDGSSGLGLADLLGDASLILRGGINPALCLFSSTKEPLVSMGVVKKVPHLYISGEKDDEKILLQGSKSNSLFVIDEEGKVKIMICKKGVFQIKDEEKIEKKEEKIFTLDDHQTLFPDLKKEDKTSR